jgi:hypothetical protein
LGVLQAEQAWEQTGTAGGPGFGGWAAAGELGPGQGLAKVEQGEGVWARQPVGVEAQQGLEEEVTPAELEQGAEG